ncbi:hypothetical protein H0H81_002983 [Sphagnurus paluster]|uniref:Uncharacterized protein n=1 Tax=Sphagnurus paluster TaxID=117069 RepID=A0A9P7K7J3_9AGAR|nr:hypothetical protein H0H81_002983 [Sphagnurus paluster]
MPPEQVPQTPDDIDELYHRVWAGYSQARQTELAESFNQLNANLIPSSVNPPLPNPLSQNHRPSLSSGGSSGASPRARRPLPPTPAAAAVRPFSADLSFDRTTSTDITQPSQSHQSSSIHTNFLRLEQVGRDPVVHSAIPSIQDLTRRHPDEIDDLDDSSSLYPSDSTPPLPVYQKENVDLPAPSYYVDRSLNINESRHSTRAGNRASFSSENSYAITEQRSTASPQQLLRGPILDSSPYGSHVQGHQSTSELSYIDSVINIGFSGVTNGQPFHASEASVSPSVYSITLPPGSSQVQAERPPVLHHAVSSNDIYLNLDAPDEPGASYVARRPTQVLRDIMAANQGRLELHDEDEDGYRDDDEEEPDRFVNFSLLSHLAVKLRDNVPKGEHVKGSIPYPLAFTGKDIVSTIHTNISRELVENHGATPNDRRAALEIARSLQSQLMFYEVEWGSRVLQDGVEDVYMFIDEQEGNSDGPREALPTSVVTILTKCYSPSCGEVPECYAYSCPRKGDSIKKLLPAAMELPSSVAPESWPKTVPPEILRSLSQMEINRQISIIHKLISKEEQYIKDLDLIDTNFIQPLRQANPPLITPKEKLETFIESVFHNILELRECNRRLLEALYVRQREQAPVIGGIGDILLGIVATEFRDTYPVYIGNHPLAERRMRDELENNSQFRLFIERCSRQNPVRYSVSMRLDLRHFLNRPSEHLQKYPVLLQAICKATDPGNPDGGFVQAAIEAIKSLKGVAQLRTFQLAMGSGPTAKWTWQDLVSSEVKRKYSNMPDEVIRQSVIFELIKAEMSYVRDLENISTIYIRALRNSNPPIIPPERLDQFIKDVFHNYVQLRVHHRRLVNVLHRIQGDEHPKIKSITAAVFDAVLNFRHAYLEYIPNYPIAAYRIDEEMERNPTFKAFVENCIQHPDAHRMSMKDFLNCPLSRLLSYVETLREILNVTPRGHEDLRSIPEVIELIEALGRETEAGVASSKQKVQLWTYNANLVFRPGETMDLDLLNESRSLIHTGKIFRKPESGPEANAWSEIFALLFDNYLVMTKPQEKNGATQYHVVARPIPLELLSLTKFSDHPTQRGSGASRRSGRSSASVSSGHSDSGDAQALYPFTIHHNGRFGGSITLHTTLDASRAEWQQKLVEATGLRKVVQESNKVFEMETLSLHTFFTPATDYSLPLSTRSETNPIPAKVTCSIPFNTPDGRRLVAIGCAEGIWIGFRHDSNYDFGLFLVLADKSDSHFHILEPVLEKIHERPKAPSGMFGFTRSPNQEWFRLYKEFFLSTEAHDLVFLKTKIAILGSKGFEIMDINNSSSTLIPQADPRIAPLVQRYKTCRPIGIFRSREDEYLLCYTGMIGTPLPPLEKSKDTGEFVPLWKQDVRDEKGRRRLHGAFTGGFSAGYFNTVGSKEGWTPATFVSSRSDRAKQKAARPEDFMDEEDLQELKDSRKLVDTTDEMDLAGGNRGGVDEPEKDSIASALEASLLPPPSDSAGARILKKMGWRLGQGIGPRVSLRKRKLQDMQLSFGGRVSSELVNIPDDDEEASKHTYAPRDTPVLLVERKDNSHGLGYNPGMGLHESLGGKTAAGNSTGPKLAGACDSISSPSLLSQISAGFGLGALNDADEDDLDVYDGGHATNRRREAYDITERDEEDTIAIGGRSERGKRPPVVSQVSVDFSQLGFHIPKRPASSVSTFRDGQPVLAGFVLSDQPVSEDRWFPLPDIPKGWTPDPRRVWDKYKNDQENIPGKQQPPKAGWDSKITADERGAMLGETPLPSAPRSVFDFMSKKDRERLQNIAATQGQPPVPGLTPQPPTTITLEIKIPRTEPHIAQAALKGFQPFATDPAKQARYNAYLQSQLGSDTGPPLQPLAQQRIDEFNKEVEDYAKAALLFKPMSAAMAGRFTSAAVVDNGPKIYEGLHTPSHEESARREEEKRKEEEENLSPKAHAARMGMYGPLTREKKPWIPAKLLCKRFKVKDPNPEPEEVAPPAPGSNWQQSEFPTASSSTGGGEASGSGSGSGSGGRSGPRDISNIGLGEDESQGQDTLTYERPPMDVFKAIFASDDEDSDDEEEAARVTEPPQPTTASTVLSDTVTPSVTAMSQPLPPPTAPMDTGPVDLNSFKPTFIPREGKKHKDKDSGQGKDKEKKEKKEKRKKEKRPVLSFAMDDEGNEEQPSKERAKKKHRKEKRAAHGVDDDDAMWVEKPAAEAVKDLVLPPPPQPTPMEEVEDSGSSRGRKRAVDFM